MSYESESEGNGSQLEDTLPLANSYYSFPPPRKFGKRKCKPRHVLIGYCLFMVAVFLPTLVLIQSIFAFIPRKDVCNPTPICYEVSGICVSACALLIGLVYFHWYITGKKYPLFYTHIGVTIIFLGFLALTVVSYGGFSMSRQRQPSTVDSAAEPAAPSVSPGDAPGLKSYPKYSRTAILMLLRFPPLYIALVSTWAVALVIGLAVWVIARRSGGCARNRSVALDYESDSNAMLLL